MNKLLQLFAKLFSTRRVKRSRSPDNIGFVQNLLRDATKVMNEFPADYRPRRDISSESFGDLESLAKSASQSHKARALLEGISDGWPGGFHDTFLQLTGLIGQVLSGYGPSALAQVEVPEVMAAGLRDPKILELLFQAAQISKERRQNPATDNPDTEKGALFFDPNDMPELLIAEAKRRAQMQRTPFGNTISTLLGQNALQWLTAPSQEGWAKIQPHEFSRTGWKDLGSIDNQIKIEQELSALGKDNEEAAKTVVTACWTTAALASFIEPVVFLTEAGPHLSSERNGQLTISSGAATRTIVTFDPASMRSVVKILHDALAEPELTACDLMWVAAGLAKIKSIRSGHSGEIEPPLQSYSLFLSHRGKDAKKQLAKELMGLRGQHDIFLDCLTLPRGLINRKFVFDSLTRADRILLIETAHYDESVWCRKERWVANAMEQAGLATVSRIPLTDAVKVIPNSSRAKNLAPVRASFEYPITERVLKDVEYWGRQPNKYSLSEKKLSVEFLKSIEDFLETRLANKGSRCPKGAAQAANKLIGNLVAVPFGPDPIDPWSTTLQYIVAAFGLEACAQSKMDVRRSIDQMNATLRHLITSKIFDDPVFRQNMTAYMCFFGAAVVLDLSGFVVKEDSAIEIQKAVQDVALLRDGVLLLDVRSTGAKRGLHLKLLLALVTHNIGSVGMIQRSTDMVHELTVDGLPVSILPCVTVHPGMESIFPE